MKKIGYSIGITRPNRIEFITDFPVRLGQFVILEYEENGKNHQLLGMIQKLERENPFLKDVAFVSQVEGMREFSNPETIIRGEINILGLIVETDNEIFLQVPRTPPLPASPIYEADPELLKKLFGSKKESFVRIGTLLSEKEEVPVYIDINQVVLRHLAILAVTGAGKSNTVSVLLKNIVDKKGTAVVFDFHGEYTKTKITRNGKIAVNHIKPFINPVHLKVKEFASLIGIKQNAHVQYRYFRLALENLLSDLNDEKGEDWERFLSTEEFLDRLKEEVENIANIDEESNKKKIKGKVKDDSLYEVLNKLEDTYLELGHIIKLGVPPLIDVIKEGYINVFDFSELDEDVADTIASNILRWSLEERKKAVRQGGSKLPFPILIVIEEAHILAGEKRNTESKYWIGRIAREGRKFALGLTIVTQRPKGLDKEILSQMNNMIILKLVEPEDQKHVQRASESLSAELMEYLPSLNPGEAILLGNMTKIPLLVKIDKAKEKIEGNDINVVDEWANTNIKENSSDILDELDYI